MIEVDWGCAPGTGVPGLEGTPGLTGTPRFVTDLAMGLGVDEGSVSGFALGVSDVAGWSEVEVDVSG
jgi:hypothetical protein